MKTERREITIEDGVIVVLEFPVDFHRVTRGKLVEGDMYFSKDFHSFRAVSSAEIGGDIEDFIYVIRKTIVKDPLCSKFKKNMSKPLKVAGIVEGLKYHIREVSSVITDHRQKFSIDNPPQVGEVLSFEIDFSPGDGCVKGWDRLMVFIPRRSGNHINNFCLYFAHLSSLRAYLKEMKLELAVDLAIVQIQRIEHEAEQSVAKIMKDYGIQ